MSDSSTPASTKNAPVQVVSCDDLMIRRMKAIDVDGVMPIEAVSFGRHHWSADSFQNEIKNQIGRYYTLLHKPDNRVIGYCGYWIVMDEAHITTIAVHNDFRGASLGEVLLIKMLDRMQGQSIKYVTLEVRATNLPAQQLYYKYDFQTLGRRPHYYQDTDEDALIMTTPDINSAPFRQRLRENKQQLMQRTGGRLPEGME